MSERKRAGKKPPRGVSGQGSVRKASADGECSAAQQQERLDSELAWCIQQLESGLCGDQSHASSAQEQQAVKALRILRSDTAPLVKKRQLMRNTFGDYRQKMLQDTKKYSAAARRVKIQPFSAARMKSTYYRRKQTHTAGVSALTQGLGQASLGGEEGNGYLGNVTQRATGSDFNATHEPIDSAAVPTSSSAAAGFTFNFSIASDGNISAADTPTEACPVAPPGGEAPPGVLPVNQPTVNYYKLETSDAPFNFGFSIPGS